MQFSFARRLWLIAIFRQTKRIQLITCELCCIILPIRCNKLWLPRVFHVEYVARVNRMSRICFIHFYAANCVPFTPPWSIQRQQSEIFSVLTNHVFNIATSRQFHIVIETMTRVWMIVIWFSRQDSSQHTQTHNNIAIEMPRGWHCATWWILYESINEQNGLHRHVNCAVCMDWKQFGLLKLAGVVWIC